MRVIATCLFTLLAAACGNVSSFTDAGSTDSNSYDSAPTIDANPRGLVKVTVLDPTGTGAPVTGVPVVFVEPDGTVAARVATDGQGKAQAEVLPGSSVTAVYTVSTNEHAMHTITGAQIGDDIVITPQLNSSPAGTFTVNFPPLSGATYYYVSTPCGLSYAGLPANNQYVVTFYQFCKPATTMTVSVVGFTASGFGGYLEKANVAVSAGATTLTGSWQTGVNYSANFTNIPTEAAYLSHNRATPDVAGYSFGNSAQVTGPMMNLQFTAATGASAVATTRLQNTQYAQQQTIYQTIAGSALSYNLDVGANLLPWIGQPTLDVTTGVIKVATSGAGTGDLFRVSAGYSRTTGNTTEYYRWVVYSATATDITLPKLPAEVGDVNPKTGDVVQDYNWEATLGDSDVITGYDQVREHACQIYAASLTPYGNINLGMSTLVRVSYFQNAS
ncbi:MAG: hypothetical protein K8W52_01590 [Deltaproteobacteria bacterium]|nr:hypothetical protein [Deltaproteobacteria bacterium]